MTTAFDIDGVTPAAIESPTSAEGVASILARASEHRLSTVIRGAGSKLGWGRRPRAIDLALDLAGLSTVIAHDHGDLTATFDAGVTLRAANEALAQHGQWLPVDPMSADRATIGGLLATNESGPLRHRYGTPRDLVIGVRVATTSGVVAKAGGKVVKNVAGYDLSRLMTGSFGSLAAIVSATFKLAPLPEATGTALVRVEPGRAAPILRDLMAAPLDALAFDVILDVATNAPARMSLALRFASVPEAVEAQLGGVDTIARSHGTRAEVLTGAADRAFWHERREAVPVDHALLRVSWRPASLDDVCDIVRTIGGGARRVFLAGRATMGAGVVGIDASIDAQVAAVQTLRASPHVGHVVIRHGSAALRERVDVWGGLGTREVILQSVKRALDPHGILNAGRGPL